MTRGQKRYQEYLSSERWHVLRQEALFRANNRCQLCNTQGRLEIHHRTYSRKGKKGEMYDLIVLCSACHAKHHDKAQPISKGVVLFECIEWIVKQGLAHVLISAISEYSYTANRKALALGIDKCADAGAPRVCHNPDFDIPFKDDDIPFEDDDKSF